MQKHLVQFRSARDLGRPLQIGDIGPLEVARRMPEDSIGFRLSALNGTPVARGRFRVTSVCAVNYYVDGANGMVMTRSELMEFGRERALSHRTDHIREIVEMMERQRIHMAFLTDQGLVHLLRRNIMVVNALLDGLVRI